jgi:predicted hydrocarbon binding protein
VGEAKGTIYLSVAKFAVERFGEESVERVLGEMTEADRLALSDVLAVGWYPLEPVIEFHRALDRLYGAGDLALVYEVGKYSAEWQLNAFHKFVLQFASPHWMVSKAGQLWNRYHKTGTWEVEQPADQRVVGRLRGFDVSDPCFCMRERGWFTRAVELTGGRDVHVEEPRCTSRGDAFCEYVGTWRS